MKVYAISDLHLSTVCDKPMDIFGSAWENYWEQIVEDWNIKVSDDDIVLIAGDISWGMKLDDALPDINEIARLKGKKILIRGNHDYWWQSYSKVKDAMPDGIIALQNNAVKIGKLVITGTRGWNMPEDCKTEHDLNIYKREIERLKLCLNAAKKLYEDGDTIILMVHYPPFNARFEDSEITKLIESTDIMNVVYGHLHGFNCRAKAEINKKGVRYYLTSCDLTGNRLVLIAD